MTDIPYSSTRFDPPHIDGFEILSTAGTGGMSVVYRARQVGLDRVVAIKMLHKHLLLDSNSVQRFVKEGRLATKLNHPNIAGIMNCGTTISNEPFLVMEFLEGKSLKEKLQSDGTLSPSEFRELFIQVCDGLQCAHSAGIVHRDLKPGNIVLVAGDNGATIPKIVDFGIAKFVDLPTPEQQKLTQTGSFIGSPTYSSPEQCTSKAVDARSDIYSLGCVMYESLAGKPPFNSDNIFELTSAHVNERPPALNTVAPGPIPKNVNDVVMQCLEKDPDARPRSAATVMNVLSGAEQATASKIAAPKKSTKYNTKLFVAVLGGFVISALGAAAMFSFFGHATGVDTTIESADQAIKAGQYAQAASILERADIVAMSPETRDRYVEKEYELALAAIENNDMRVFNAVRDALVRQRGTIRTAQVFDWCLQVDAWFIQQAKGKLPSREHASQLREDAKGNPFLQYLFESRLAANVYGGGDTRGVPGVLHDAVLFAKESGRPSAIVQSLYHEWQWRTTYKGSGSADATVDEGMTYVPELAKQSDFISAQALMRLGEPLLSKKDWAREKIVLDAVDQIHTRTAFPSWLTALVAYDKARYCQSQGDFDGMIKNGEIGMKSRFDVLGRPANCHNDDLFKQTYSDFIAPQVEGEFKRAMAAQNWQRALEMAQHLEKEATWAGDSNMLAASYERMYHSRRRIDPKDLDMGLLEKAVETVRAQPPSRITQLSLCRCLSEVGAEEFAAHQYDKALIPLEEAYNLIKDHSELRKGRVATVPITLARTYIRLNQKDKAKPLFAAYFREAEKEYGGSASDFIKLSREEYAAAFPNDAKLL